MATGILSTGAAQKSPFINPSTLWTILVCPRSYPHAKSLDAIDDRDGDLHWPSAGLGWRRHLGLGHRLTTLALARWIAVLRLHEGLVGPEVSARALPTQFAHMSNDFNRSISTRMIAVRIGLDRLRHRRIGCIEGTSHFIPRSREGAHRGIGIRTRIAHPIVNMA